MKKYTETHEWIKVDSATNSATVGVTDYAQHELGDVVYVELPQVGKSVKAGQEVVVLESTKAAADVYSPVSGKILEVNQTLKEQTHLVNESAEDKAWLYKMSIENSQELAKLLDQSAYLKQLSH